MSFSSSAIDIAPPNSPKKSSNISTRIRSSLNLFKTGTSSKVKDDSSSNITSISRNKIMILMLVISVLGVIYIIIAIFNISSIHKRYPLIKAQYGEKEQLTILLNTFKRTDLMEGQLRTITYSIILRLPFILSNMLWVYFYRRFHQILCIL